MIGIRTNVRWTLAQKIIDPLGRFIILKGCLYSHKVLLLGLYAPNQTQTVLGAKKVKDCNCSGILALGDFNGVFNKDIDRSHKSTTPGLPKNFHRLVRAFDLTDVWRVRNPLVKDFFFPHRYSTYSRIDMIWLSKELSLLLSDSEIGVCYLSDHVGLKLIISAILLGVGG